MLTKEQQDESDKDSEVMLKLPMKVMSTGITMQELGQSFIHHFIQ